MRGTRGPQRRLVRLLLVVCTVAGLASMHSLGHEALMHSHDRDHAGHHGGSGLIGLGTGMEHASGASCEDGCTGQVAQQAPSSGHDHLMDLCFAILGGVLLMLLLRGALRQAGVVLLQRRLPVSGAAPSRAPPQVRVGLTLATVAVLRT